MESLLIEICIEIFSSRKKWKKGVSREDNFKGKELLVGKKVWGSVFQAEENL